MLQVGATGIVDEEKKKNFCEFVLIYVTNEQNPQGG
jgi:hypothetical protein